MNNLRFYYNTCWTILTKCIYVVGSWVASWWRCFLAYQPSSACSRRAALPTFQTSWWSKWQQWQRTTMLLVTISLTVYLIVFCYKADGPIFLGVNQGNSTKDSLNLGGIVNQIMKMIDIERYTSHWDNTQKILTDKNI